MRESTHARCLVFCLSSRIFIYTRKSEGLFFSVSVLSSLSRAMNKCHVVSHFLWIFFFSHFEKKNNNIHPKENKIAKVFVLFNQTHSPWNKVCFIFVTIASKPLYLPTNSNGLMYQCELKICIVQIQPLSFFTHRT